MRQYHRAMPKFSRSSDPEQTAPTTPSEVVPSPTSTDFDLLAEPYLARQRILVVNDALAEKARPEMDRIEREGTTGLLDRVRRRGSEIADKGLAEVVSAALKMRANDADVLLVARREATSLRLPPPHPLPKTVYVGHPLIATQYYPAALFHRYLVEDKFAELLRLLTSLGASSISVQQVQGRRKDDLVEAVIGGIPGADAQAKSRKRAFSRSALAWSGTLSGHKNPHLPEGQLVWYEWEPMWKHIAEARMQYGQREFSLMLRHDDAMGVDRDLKAAIKGAGLEAGGEFIDHEAVAWQISGTFL